MIRRLTAGLGVLEVLVPCVNKFVALAFLIDSKLRSVFGRSLYEIRISYSYWCVNARFCGEYLLFLPTEWICKK